MTMSTEFKTLSGSNEKDIKEYIASTKLGPQKTVGRRSGVVIQSHIRKDEQGFEDIDDFWAEDQMFSGDDEDDEDDLDGNDSTMLWWCIANASDINVAMFAASVVSEASMHVSISSISSSPFRMASSAIPKSSGSSPMELASSAEPADVDFGEPDELDESDTMDLQNDSNSSISKSRASSDSKRKALESAAEELAAAASKTRASLQKDNVAVSPRQKGRKMKISESTSCCPYAHMSAVDKTSTTTSTIAIPEQSLPDERAEENEETFDPHTPPRQEHELDKPPTEKSTHRKAKAHKWRLSDPMPEKPGFDQVQSPFSVADPLTPLSNASDKNLKSIKPFSERDTNSPEISIQLFRGSEDNISTGSRHRARRRQQRSMESLKKFSSPERRKRRYSYKDTPTTDVSTDLAQTDNDATFQASSGDEDDERDVQKVDRELDITELSHADEILKDADDLNEGRLRRSKRRRYKPLAWYKGEHFVYERRESGVGLVVPTVVGVERAGTKTPIKKETMTRTKKSAARSRQRPFPKDKLPKEFKYDEDEWADLYDAAAGCENKMNVVCRSHEIELRDLPSLDGQPVGCAGQSFNLRNTTPISRWISGRLDLPPGGAKEAESVGEAVQVFFVVSGQPQALEVALGPASDEYFDAAKATRFVLSPGDEFYVPAHNAYYLKNHSASSDSELRFMIMKPDSKARGSTPQHH
ncbi:TPA: hypothetical protein N0F65_008213 [Lagenidium giganteum]|uniref:Mif2/CENP-C cupin domain-containing protein n=1 Tax=Lagenidium giganteum TaxID=4803 RepID=A0AAV2YYE5_9STRA|nr:TPA: hypothetical protein N0F65_008213 [Lagenidium giganteum]